MGSFLGKYFGLRYHRQLVLMVLLKLSSGSFSRHYWVLLRPICLIVQLRKYSPDFECQMCRRKEKVQSLLEYRHCPLVVTADTWNGSRPPGLRPMYRLFSFHQKQKTKKGKKWYELTPRYQRARPKYGQSALHLSSGRENKQALSGVHETLHPIGIALFGLTAWGSNPQKGLRLKYFFFTILYMVPFDFCAPNCPLAVKCLSLEHDPPAGKDKTYE